MPKGNTTPNRGRGPLPGHGGRPITGAGVECRIKWPDREIVEGLKKHRDAVIAFIRALKNPPKKEN